MSHPSLSLILNQLLVLRTVGVLVPIAVMARVLCILHRRRQQQVFLDTFLFFLSHLGGPFPVLTVINYCSGGTRNTYFRIWWREFELPSNLSTSTSSPSRSLVNRAWLEIVQHFSSQVFVDEWRRKRKMKEKRKRYGVLQVSCCT